MPFEIHHGDCLDVLKAIPDNSVDSIVTDPPYGLSFMGKRWDYDVPSVEIWAECLRVLKPGGHLLAFAGTRTQHRMAARIEDAGFEIRDMIAWVYGSGFPKSLNVAKAVDSQITLGGSSQSQMRKRDMDDEYRPHKNAGTEGFGDGNLRKGADGDRDLSAAADLQTDAARQWQGWGTALKPALEPITVARKPLIGTVAANVLAHGTGALNIDGCRVAAEAGGRPLREVAPLRDNVQYHGNALAGRADGSLASSRAIGSTDQGRFPANLIHDGSDEVLALFPDSNGSGGSVPQVKITGYGDGAVGTGKSEYIGGPRTKHNAGTGSAARFFNSFSHSEEDSWAGIELPPLDASTAESSSLQQRQAAVSALALVVRGVLPGGLHCAPPSAEPSMSATASELRLIAEAVTTAMPSIVSAFLRGRQHERLFLTLNHVSVVAQKTQIDTMTITASLSKSDGSVVSITFSIMPSNLVAGEEGCEQSPGRFMYCAKASKKDRGEGNGHPTVKPTDLMRYLCRLVTPPGGVVLDPFLGSGSTGKAAMLEGFRFIGIEREAEHIPIAKARIEHALLADLI